MEVEERLETSNLSMTLNSAEFSRVSAKDVSAGWLGSVRLVVRFLFACFLKTSLYGFIKKRVGTQGARNATDDTLQFLFV